MKVMPNQIIAHRTLAEAWRRACSIVNTYGDKVITEDRKVTKEVRNLMVQLLEPGESWPIPGSFREGDWTRLGNLNEYIQYDHRDLFREEIDAIQRLQAAAKLAEDLCK